jgi:hypothetical protein
MHGTCIKNNSSKNYNNHQKQKATALHFLPLSKTKFRASAAQTEYLKSLFQNTASKLKNAICQINI